MDIQKALLIKSEELLNSINKQIQYTKSVGHISLNQQIITNLNSYNW